jgi:hypothetical protein
MNPHNQPASGTTRLRAPGRHKTRKDFKVKVYQDEPPYGSGGLCGSLLE